MPKNFLLQIILCCLLLTTFSCIYKKVTIKGKGNMRLTQVEFNDFSQWQNIDHRGAIIAFTNSCRQLAKMPHNRLLGAQIGDITAADFRDTCEIANVVKGMSNNQIKNFFENWFRPFLVATRSGNANGLFTGYYEANLRGSKTKDEKYRFAIHAKPKDLNGSDPYLTRQEINNGALDNKNLELFYVDDLADLFFLHVQGSGRITLPDGSVVRLSFAAKNNQPYISIGNYFADNKLIDSNKISANSIKDWMRANPEKALEVTNYNPSYIFFKHNESEYVIGAQGVSLTAEHSLAVDNEFIPFGLPVLVETFFKKNGGKEKYSQLVIAQDSGSAIKGVVRGDIFFGHGLDAENKASAMASSGKYYVLLPNNVVDKIMKK